MQYRRRRVVSVLIVLLALLGALVPQLIEQQKSAPAQPTQVKPAPTVVSSPALSVLDTLEVKGRAPKTGYARAQFGDGWLEVGGCDTRNIILNRDMTNVTAGDDCKVVSGVLDDPYTGKTIDFMRGANTSALVQIDHVVALSNAWQTGAQQLTAAQRISLANDPLELLAGDGSANQQKSDGDAATWLPPNKAFRCQYVARQIAVKAKYNLWVTSPEKQAMLDVLAKCPQQQLPVSTK